MSTNDAIVEFTSPGRGYAIAPNVGVATFEIEGISASEDIRSSEYRNLYKMYASENSCVNIQNYWVPMWGEGHNLYPQEVHSLVNENKLLPSIIKKRIDFLFGKGPYLYKEEIVDGDISRVPVVDREISDWLDSWEDKGYPSSWEYLKNLITDFYYVNTCISQYHFNRSRRLGNIASVDALSYVGSDEARLAASGNFLNQQVKQSDCNYVLVGPWLNLGSSSFSVYNRFDPRSPIAYPEAIAFNSEKSFSKWVYAYNDWFKGLYEWIKASNLTPKYLNSYLKNALNAHVHCKIPASWYNQQREILSDICNTNLMGDDSSPLQSEYRGVRLIDDDGRPYRYNESMMQGLIANELKRITALMSGEGKNQGKLYATIKVGDEGWEFDEFPSKFKDYFDSVISYDKRSDQIVLAGMGISSSITNVENDGVISKSGSDVYYNYIIYLNTLVYPEYFVCKEINRAIRMNFPRAKKEGIKLGFKIDIPSKMQEVAPADRLDQTLPGSPNAKTSKV